MKTKNLRIKHINNFLILLLIFSFSNCKKTENNFNQTKKTEVLLNKEDSLNNEKNKELIKEKTAELNSEKKESFTIDCGSGCALVYDVKSKNGNEVEFKVTNYINEEVSDEYSETYIFDCDSEKKLKNIHLKDKTENILNDKDSGVREDLKKFGEKFCN